MLNAKHHEREAEIVAQAGRAGAVTIATNMAGRGTDIILGGNPEAMAWAPAPGEVPDPPRSPAGRMGRAWSTKSSTREMKVEGREVAGDGRAAHHRHRAAREPAGSTSSFAAVAAARATPAAAASTSPWKTT